MTTEGNASDLLDVVRASRRLVVLTGAGVSTDSGIPDYRDRDGSWKHRAPVQYRDFVRGEATRRRYWARSRVGWKRIEAAAPNGAHVALAGLEAAGRVHHLLTQNVDGLHQKAGSARVLDLHGRLDQVACLACGHTTSRAALQIQLERLNPGVVHEANAPAAPDGDAAVDPRAEGSFVVPDCALCGGVLKPRVVFFGENVPRETTEAAFARVDEADALLVVGSSLMVYSGYRFARRAHERGIPLAILNLGRTRADDLASLRVAAPCAEVLLELQEELGAIEV